MLALSPLEVRVLATLIEKEITTPDYYPMTLNALTNACNQKSNRDPVMNLDDNDVLQAFESAVKQGLARYVDEGKARVAKLRGRLPEALRLTAPQTAVLCELMLRGAQTLGELKSRTERMFVFGSSAVVEAVLTTLAAHTAADGTPEPLVVRLPRQAGQKEARFAQCLSGAPTEPSVEGTPHEVDTEAQTAASKNTNRDANHDANHEERITMLEAEIVTLKQELAVLQGQFRDVIG